MRTIIYSAVGAIALTAMLVLTGTAPGRSPVPAPSAGLDVSAMQSTIDMKTLPDGNLPLDVYAAP
jgi:hypothetical protein